MSGFWTKEIIEECLQQISAEGESGYQALSGKFNREITQEGLRKACSRYLEKPLGEVLKELCQSTEEEGSAIQDYESLLALLEGRLQHAIVEPDKKINRDIQDGEEVMMLDIGDVHMGSEVRTEEVGGMAEYNIEVMKQRLTRLVDKVASITAIQRRGGTTVRRLIINCLGDMLDGEGIFRGHERELEVLGDEQVWELGEYWTGNFFKKLLGEFESIDVHCVIGNHGRLGFPGERSRRLNLDHFLYRMWNIRLADEPNLAFHIAKGAFHIYREMGRLHVLTHGDQVKAYQGIPFYGLDKLRGKFQSMLGESIFSLHIGHFHSPASIPSGRGGRLSLNGAWPGGSDFSINRLTSSSLPSQWLRSLNERGICGEWNVELDTVVRLDSNNGVLTPSI